MGKIHFWATFFGTYAIYLPMHYLGIMGLPRRYYAMGTTDFLPDSAQVLNANITLAAIWVALFQVIFIFNMVWSLWRGKEAGPNPWEATSLEWQTPDTPPCHGNWGPELPTVYRWAYEYSVPGVKADFVPQNMAPEDVEMQDPNAKYVGHED
jgi:cytochrome c oxidase subunit 1